MKRKIFKFGKNWEKFLLILDDRKIENAIKSLKDMLEIENLNGKTFLDIGSGSGLFSLAVIKLGAKFVYSFDSDPQCVGCTTELKHRYFHDKDNWIIEKGSILDNNYIKSIGQYDIVYSWGVLHHTGAMWQALENVIQLVKDRGKLYVAIYNDQGRTTKYWKFVKILYNYLPKAMRFLILVPVFIRVWGPTTIRGILCGRPFYTWRNYDDTRGMSPWRDVVDWVGGYPFEVAKPEQIVEFYKKRGFHLERLVTSGGSGCNQYVFTKENYIAKINRHKDTSGTS